MAGYVIGIDAGGTKTAFALGGPDGRILATAEGLGGSIHQYGADDIVGCLDAGIREILETAGVQRRQIAFVAAGMPFYGEGDAADEAIRAICRRAFGELPYTIVNDGVNGYMGALSGRPGINVVSGTGSIAFGMDESGKIARCGGWTEHFSDEGSCYWLGKQAMALFCREADGRAPKGAMYRLFCETYHLKNDFDFVARMEQEVIPLRSEVAAQQKLLLQAAGMGDPGALEIYARGACELAELAFGAASQLRFSGTVEVSMTGGALHAMKYMREAWEEALAAHHMVYSEAEHSPVEGAVMLALKNA